MARDVGSVGTTVGMAVLTATAVPNNLAGMLPSLMTIQRFGAEDVDRKALRRGEVLGSAVSLAEGVAASLLTGSWLPTLATVIVLGIYLAAYEHAIQNPAEDATPIDQQG